MIENSETVGHGGLSGYSSWMSNHRPDLRETCWQVSSIVVYIIVIILCVHG